jgi:Ca2+-binding RTX toxin-like protein
MTGGLGNDWLDGGAGIDRLTGGGDTDMFVLARLAADRDIIADFTQGSDKLVVNSALFGPQFAPGTTMQPWQLIASAAPVAGAPGQAAFLFNTSNGVLRYDADGAGGAAAVHVATLSTARSLTLDDFMVI